MASGDISSLLRSWSCGDQRALERLVPLVDAALRRIARHHLKRRPPDPVLSTTACVNEVYLRLIDQRETSWRDRVHFLALCARIMRGIVVDHERARLSQKRGGGVFHVAVTEEMAFTADRTIDIIAIDQALSALTEMDPRKGRVVELRFFGGLTVEETAEALGVSKETVSREWRLARMWLLKELTVREALPASEE